MDVFFSFRENMAEEEIQEIEKVFRRGKFDVSFFPNRTNFMVQYLALQKLTSFDNRLGNHNFQLTLFPDPKPSLSLKNLR